MKSESYVHAAIQAAKEENPNDMQDLIGQALNDKITDAIFGISLSICKVTLW